MLTLVGGHLVFGEPMEFPHLCPGDDCAIGQWMIAKKLGIEFRRRYDEPHPPKPVPPEPISENNAMGQRSARVLAQRKASGEIGKTWPELVAEKL